MDLKEKINALIELGCVIGGGIDGKRGTMSVWYGDETLSHATIPIESLQWTKAAYEFVVDVAYRILINGEVVQKTENDFPVEFH